MAPEVIFWLFVALVTVGGCGTLALVISIVVLAHRVGFPFPVSTAHFLYPAPPPPPPPIPEPPDASRRTLH